jgi:hypothetical protein
LDIAREYGVEFYCLSHNLRFKLNSPFRILREEATPSGQTIQTFTRFAPSWTTNAWTMAEMITRDSLERAIAANQNVIYFSHWGTRGWDADPRMPLLNRESLTALEILAELQAQGYVRVVRLKDLLDREQTRRIDYEVERIGTYQIKSVHSDLDQCYKMQFEPRKISYMVDHALVLNNFHATACPGGTRFITVNGDGFYQHAICEKRMNIENYSRLLWNTFFRRISGNGGLRPPINVLEVRKVALQGGEVAC